MIVVSRSLLTVNPQATRRTKPGVPVSSHGQAGILVPKSRPNPGSAVLTLSNNPNDVIL